MAKWVAFNDRNQIRHYIKVSEVTRAKVDNKALELWYGSEYVVIHFNEPEEAKYIADAIAEIEGAE